MEEVLTLRKWMPRCWCSVCNSERKRGGYWATVIETLAGDVIDDRAGVPKPRCHDCEMKRLAGVRRRLKAEADRIEKVTHEVDPDFPIGFIVVSTKPKKKS